MRVFDAHVHFDLRSDDPIRDFESHYSNNCITSCVLILNSETEISLFEDNYERLQDSVGERMIVAGIFDTHTSIPCPRYEKWREWGFRTCLKIHPRKSNLTKKDSLSLADKLEGCTENTVIIDCFEYGHRLENHIGIELGIHLAEHFPEKRIILAHAGGHRALECMLYTRTLKNIYYDLALSCNYLYGTSAWIDLVHLVRYNPNKAMFGSDYPDFSQNAAMEKCLELCEKAELSERNIESVFFGNAEAVFGTGFRND